MNDWIYWKFRIFQALTLVFLLYNKKHGLQTSGLLFLFWFLLALFGVPQFRSEIRRYLKESDADYNFISFMIYYSLVVLMFFLNCWADKAPRISKYPKVDVSMWNYVFFYCFLIILSLVFRIPVLRKVVVSYLDCYLLGLIRWHGRASEIHWKRRICGQWIQKIVHLRLCHYLINIGAELLRNPEGK